MTDVLCATSGSPGSAVTSRRKRRNEKQASEYSADLRVCWSGGQDLNLRPLDPQSSALPNCATTRIANRYINSIFWRMQGLVLATHDLDTLHEFLSEDLSLKLGYVPLVCCKQPFAEKQANYRFWNRTEKKSCVFS